MRKPALREAVTAARHAAICTQIAGVREDLRAIGVCAVLMACGKAQGAAPLARSATTPSASARAALPPQTTNAESMPEVEVVCQQSAALQIPAPDLPADSELAQLHECDADAAYYGIDAPVDFERARRCAIATRLTTSEPENADAGILMMLYANAHGVPQNYDLALHFACKLGGDPQGLAPLLTKLWAARSTGE